MRHEKFGDGVCGHVSYWTDFRLISEPVSTRQDILMFAWRWQQANQNNMDVPETMVRRCERPNCFVFLIEEIMCLCTLLFWQFWQLWSKLWSSDIPSQQYRLVTNLKVALIPGELDSGAQWQGCSDKWPGHKREAYSAGYQRKPRHVRSAEVLSGTYRWIHPATFITPNPALSPKRIYSYREIQCYCRRPSIWTVGMELRYEPRQCAQQNAQIGIKNLSLCLSVFIVNMNN